MGALTKATEAILTNIIARDVAAGVELARSLGYKMPKEFDVGVRFISEPRNLVGRFPLGPPPDWPIRIRMRMADATYDSLVTLPELEPSPRGFAQYRISVADVAAKWERAWTRIHADALTVAQVWIDKHPEAAMDRPSDALSFLGLAKSDDAAMAKWLAECRERAKQLKYTAGAGATLKDMTS
jgi:hypothetical protein